MTKVTKESVKCAACGVESEQMIVHSVNFALGSAQDNEKLMQHQQVCPSCGYQAPNISVRKKEYLPTEITELIRNSELPYELLSEYSKFNKEELANYKLVNNYMSFDYYAQERDLILSFQGFPNDESPSRLCGLKVVDNQYNVLGIKVGDKFDGLGELDRYMEKYDYEGLENTYSCPYHNGKVTVDFKFENEYVIKSIDIEIQSEYLGNRIY